MKCWLVDIAVSAVARPYTVRTFLPHAASQYLLSRKILEIEDFVVSLWELFHVNTLSILEDTPILSSYVSSIVDTTTDRYCILPGSFVRFHFYVSESCYLIV